MPNVIIICTNVVCNFDKNKIFLHYFLTQQNQKLILYISYFIFLNLIISIHKLNFILSNSAEYNIMHHCCIYICTIKLKV